MFKWAKWVKSSLFIYSVVGLVIVLLVTAIFVKKNKKKVKKVKVGNKNVSPAKKINEYVLEMMGDKELVEFCQRFCMEKTIPRINDLSFSFLPISHIQNTCDYVLNYAVIKNTESPYFKTLNTYSKEYVKKSQNDIARAYLCVKKDFDGKYKTDEKRGVYRLEACISKPYRKLWDSFYTLQERKLLKKRDNEFYFQAFCFVLYHEALKIFTEENNNDLKEFGLSPKDSNEKIIKTLYEKSVRKDDILTILCMNNVTKKDCCTAVKWKDPDVKALIEKEIEKQKSSNLVDRYLPDSKRKK